MTAAYFTCSRTSQVPQRRFNGVMFASGGLDREDGGWKMTATSVKSAKRLTVTLHLALVRRHFVLLDSCSVGEMPCCQLTRDR